MNTNQPKAAGGEPVYQYRWHGSTCQFWYDTTAEMYADLTDGLYEKRILYTGPAQRRPQLKQAEG